MVSDRWGFHFLMLRGQGRESGMSMRESVEGCCKTDLHVVVGQGDSATLEVRADGVTSL